MRMNKVLVFFLVTSMMVSCAGSTIDSATGVVSGPGITVQGPYKMTYLEQKGKVVTIVAPNYNVLVDDITATSVLFNQLINNASTVYNNVNLTTSGSQYTFSYSAPGTQMSGYFLGNYLQYTAISGTDTTIVQASK